MTATALVWFRNDLRLTDNPALRAAVDSGARIVPVYIHAPDEEAGEWPEGAASRWWRHRSLEALEGELRQRGARLLLRQGASLETLRALAAECGAERLYFNRLYEPALSQRDGAVTAAMEADGVRVHTHNGALLFEPGSILSGAGRPYRVFTPFWKACLAHGVERRPLPAPRRLSTPGRWPESMPLSALALNPQIAWDTGLAHQWTPGEAGARARLKTFCRDALTHYPRHRDLPAMAATSGLSPHLHFGDISPGQVLAALRAAGADHPGAEAAARQIVWREFAHHVLHHFPHTSDRPLDPRFENFPWRRDAKGLRAWQAGNTGIPMVDAGMRELWHTGWMHNRVRMITASLLTKHLGIHWLEGARWFWDTLVDADLANNSLNWQWVAGCGADAAPYFRIFNPVRQGERFDPQGDYVRRWLPALAALPSRWIHQPWAAPAQVLSDAGVELGKDYPRPLVDLDAGRREALARMRGE